MTIQELIAVSPDSDPRLIRIFLSSPGDVEDERKLALKVIEQLPYDPFLRGRIALEVVAWDKPGAGTAMLASKSPQEAINEGLPKPSDCDIVIVIFWARMGTPLGEKEVKPEAYRYPTGTKYPDTCYLSGTEWEFVDAVQRAEQGDHPVVIIYRRKEAPALKLDDLDFDTKREQWQHVTAFFKSFVNPNGSIRRGYNSYTTPDDFAAQLEMHLKQQFKKLLEEPIRRTAPTSAIPDLWQGSPFPGLRAFTPNDAPIFFGRGRETDALIQRVKESRFVAVVGASGSGKSSLVGAGLLPRLKDNAISGENQGSKDWHIVSFKPGEKEGDPFQALTDALVTTFPAMILSPLEAGRLKREFIEELKHSPEFLVDTCAVALSPAPVWAEVLLFVDQFEELFTVVQPDLRPPFVELLNSVAQAARLRMVVTMRADFYHHCVEYPQLAEMLREGSFPLAAPGLGALYEMITRPAARAGLVFEENLPELILVDTGDNPGALPLLAYTLDELYQQRPDNRLTMAAYQALGRVQGAIGQRAENVVCSLDAEAQAALPQVFRNLVEVDERGTVTRQRAPLARVTDTLAKSQLVQALTGARLLVQNQGEDTRPVVEVAHEALFRNWDRLADWIEIAQDDLRLLRQVKLAAKEWDENGRKKEFLWPDERLKPVYAMIEHLQPDLDTVIQEFIRPESERLLAELQDIDLPHARRSAIGERLCVIGDTRPGVGLRPDGLPDIVWCAVPGGKITLKDGQNKDLGTFTVQPFYIAKYPITFIQFQAFLDDPDGFERDEWWTGLTVTEAYRKMSANYQHFKFANHPSETKGWYFAVAFCRWLNAKLSALIPSPPLTQSEGPGMKAAWEIRLPAEWEWQQAATGGNPANEYPWGPERDARRCNSTESGLSRTTAVGMYPDGASPVGALDMSGNVWEWCLNECEKPANTGTAGDMRRVLRGAGIYSPQVGARAAHRADNDPTYKDANYGFRVVCAPPI